MKWKQCVQQCRLCCCATLSQTSSSSLHPVNLISEWPFNAAFSLLLPEAVTCLSVYRYRKVIWYNSNKEEEKRPSFFMQLQQQQCRSYLQLAGSMFKQPSDQFVVVPRESWQQESKHQQENLCNIILKHEFRGLTSLTIESKCVSSSNAAQSKCFLKDFDRSYSWFITRQLQFTLSYIKLSCLAV